MPPTQRWLYTEQPTGRRGLLLQHAARRRGPTQCGRVVFSTFHWSTRRATGSSPPPAWPAPMTPQEKVLEFMLFDVASCVQPDKEPPSVFRPPCRPRRPRRR